MAAYTCVNCEEEVDLDPINEKVICPQCSHRVLMKKRPETPKTVKAE
jgi:DNA-directed RNA polymerase subunit P